MTDVSQMAGQTFGELVAEARADPAVHGLFVHGSRVFEGMATGLSDYDVGLIAGASEPYERWRERKASGLDLHVTSLSALRSAVLDGGDEDRYIFAHAQVVIDRLDGRLTELVAEAGTFPARHQARLPEMLDAYLNLFYRSLKNWRDGRFVEPQFDAAESVRLALWTIFALHQRVRPPNKYLIWELQRRPLGEPAWEISVLLPRLRRILSDGDPATQRDLFSDLEPVARAAGLGGTIEAWGDDQRLFR